MFKILLGTSLCYQMFLQKGQKFKDKASFLTLNLFHGQTILNLVCDNKHGQIRKPRARTCPTLCMSMIKLVPSPSDHIVFVARTLVTDKYTTFNTNILCVTEAGTTVFAVICKCSSPSRHDGKHALWHMLSSRNCL